MGNGESIDFSLPGERRSGVDRRQFSYDVYIPERRNGKDRRQLKKRFTPGASSQKRKNNGVKLCRTIKNTFFNPEI